MALITCPDCGTEVSDAAPACPKCGRPIAAAAPPPVPQPPAQQGPGCAATGLRWGGGLWALIGIANIVIMFGKGDASTGVQTAGLMLNVLLFIIPGLILYGIGEMIARKNRP